MSRLMRQVSKRDSLITLYYHNSSSEAVVLKGHKAILGKVRVVASVSSLLLELLPYLGL